MIKTNRFIIEKFKINLVNKKYLSWFKDPITKKFISFSPNSLKDLKLDVLKKIKNKKNIFFSIKTKNKFHIGNILIHDIDLKKNLHT